MEAPEDVLAKQVDDAVTTLDNNISNVYTRTHSQKAQIASLKAQLKAAERVLLNLEGQKVAFETARAIVKGIELE